MTLLLYTGRVITQPVHELKEEFEAATGTRLVIERRDRREHRAVQAPQTASSM